MKIKERLTKSSKYFNGDKLSGYEDSPITYVHSNMEKFNKVIADLDAQLAEKDEEIAYLTKQVKKFNNEAQKYFEDAYCNDFHNQEKISFAIEKLEKVKENIEKVPITDYDLSGNFEKMYKRDAIRQIDNQIEQLKVKAIVPKFRTYQPIFYITQYYTSTKGNPEYDIISDKYYVAENENEIILGWNYAKDFNQRKYYYVRKDWVFATLEEAEQKLAEIKREVV